MELMKSDYFRAFRYRVGKWEQTTAVCFGEVFAEAKKRAEESGETLYRDRMILKPETVQDESGNISITFAIDKCYAEVYKSGAFCSP